MSRSQIWSGFLNFHQLLSGMYPKGRTDVVHSSISLALRQVTLAQLFRQFLVELALGDRMHAITNSCYRVDDVNVAF